MIACCCMSSTGKPSPLNCSNPISSSNWFGLKMNFQFYSGLPLGPFMSVFICSVSMTAVVTSTSFDSLLYMVMIPDQSNSSIASVSSPLESVSYFVQKSDLALLLSVGRPPRGPLLAFSLALVDLDFHIFSIYIFYKNISSLKVSNALA